MAGLVWLACAFTINPDIDWLAGSGGERFAMMDIKLVLVLQTMLRNAPHDAKDVAHDAQRHAERLPTGASIKIIAIILQSFRSSDRSDLMYTIEHRVSGRQEHVNVS